MVEAARTVAVGGERKLDAKLGATLAMTVVGRDGDGFTVRGELRDPRFQGASAVGNDVSAELEKPFAFTMLPTGEIKAFSFPKRASPEVAGLLKDLVMSFQMVAPPAARPSWQTTEEDATGQFAATYTQREGGVHKTKSAYQQARGPRGLAPLAGAYAVTSSVDFEIDASGWPKTVAEDESLRVEVGTMNVVSTRKTTAKLVAVERRADRIAAAERASLEPDAVSEAEAYARAKENAAKNLVGGRKLAEIAKELRAEKTQARNDATVAMSALFRIDPAATTEAAEAILHGNLDEESKARISTALGSAGTPQAQRALGAILASPDADSTTQVRAAAALGTSKNQVVENEELLTGAMASPADDVRSTAVLALGNSIHAANAEGGHDTSGALETLIDGLAKAATKAEKRTYLLALGNSGDEGALAAIVPYLTDADPDLRAAATFALRFMEGPAVDQALVAGMEDAEVAVRTAAVETVRYRALGALRAAIERVLHSDPQESVRLAVVSALNMKRGEDASVDGLIKWAMENDPSEKVRKLAKQVLTNS
jgi:HEAT repeat protein